MEAAQAVEAAQAATAEPSLSAWFGGSGGARCELACDDDTVLRGVSVRAGARVDRVELGACEALL